MSLKNGVSSISDDMTDEQMDALLAQATARLKQKAQSIDAVNSSQTAGKGLSFPGLKTGPKQAPYMQSIGGVVKVNQDALQDETQQQRSTQGFRKVEDPIALKKSLSEKKKATAGEEWFDLPKTNLTPALKRDLQLLKMRSVLDPHRHYRKENGKMQAPEFSQVGTITEGAAEYFSGRIENKKRKRTFVEEVLAGEHELKRFKKKYDDVQHKKGSGKKSFYKNVQAKRKSGVKKGG